MKHHLISLLAVLCLSTVGYSQEHPLSAFENLMNKTWTIEGKWNGGPEFKQELTFEYGLNKNIVIAKTKGCTDEAQTVFGDRNYGIRHYNPQDSSISFYEFDIMGNVTKGEVGIIGQDIGYVYEYGGTVLLELWSYVSEEEYTYQVGRYLDGNFDGVFLDAKAFAKR